MFKTTRIVQLSETDATGVIYFAEQLKWAQEVFLEAFSSNGFPLSEMMEAFSFFLPIVHVTSDYTAPIFWEDQLRIELSWIALGQKSMTFRSSIYKGEVLAGQTILVHACIDQKTKQAIHIPKNLVGVLKSIFSECGSEVAAT